MIKNKEALSKTEGAVCLFSQRSTDELNTPSLVNNILQKYTAALQHTLPTSHTYWKSKGKASFNDILLSQNGDESLRSSNLLASSEGVREHPGQRTFHWYNLFCIQKVFYQGLFIKGFKKSCEDRRDLS